MLSKIYGRKRWIIFAPDQPLYLFPFLHPSHAQSQAVIDSPNLKLFPKVAQAKGYEVGSFPRMTKAEQVILEPGDMLYLPPMWFHHVEALETSIAINCWSFSNQTRFLKDALAISKVLELHSQKALPKQQLGVMVKIFLTQVLEGVYGKGNADSFVQSLVDERYGLLFQSNQVPSASQLPSVASLCDFALWNRKAIKEIKKDFSESVHKVVSLLQLYPQDTHKVWLGNYVEYLAFEVTQNPSENGAFLQRCFSMQDKAD
jgi:hypothetical protein